MKKVIETLLGKKSSSKDAFTTKLLQALQNIQPIVFKLLINQKIEAEGVFSNPFYESSFTLISNWVKDTTTTKNFRIISLMNVNTNALI